MDFIIHHAARKEIRMLRILVHLGIAVITIGAAVGLDTPGQAATRDVSAKLQALVDGQIDTISADPIHNCVLLVETPGFKWNGAAGMADGKGEAMTPDHKFKIASITKSFTAVVILQLIEEGLLAKDGLVAEHVDPAIVDVDSLHLHGGVSCGRRITIEHLLWHTSGITDYMEDPRFIPDVLAHPAVQYSPQKIFETYLRYRTHEKAAFPPGGGWQYADPNYVLLAMIIESVTGSTLHEQFKARIFDRLGMENTYLEFYEPPRGSSLFSHAFIQQLDINTSVNTSFDWGGGGLVSTCEELNTFFRALLRGKLFEKKSTLAMMLAAADAGFGGEEYDYGLGIMKRKICGLTFYGHGGAYDCDAFYCPEKDVSVCMSLNQMLTHGKRDKFVEKAVELALTKIP